jgi:hypothetical protein
MRNQTPFALCIIGGLLLIAVGYTEGANTVIAIYMLVNALPIPFILLLIINLILLILFIIAWTGGFAILVGGYLLTAKHVGLGKFIIAIAAGFGLLSLIFAVLYVVWVFGLPGLLLLTWIILTTAKLLGIVLTVIARFRAS